MSRRCIGFLLVCSALLLGVFATPQVASAQDANDPITYPGPFEGDGADETAQDADEVLSETIIASLDGEGTDNALAFHVPDIQPTTDPATGGTGGGLAATGSDVEPIIAISVGMMAIGGSVLVSSRRRLRDFFFTSD